LYHFKKSSLRGENTSINRPASRHFTPCSILGWAKKTVTVLQYFGLAIHSDFKLPTGHIGDLGMKMMVHGTDGPFFKLDLYHHLLGIVSHKLSGNPSAQILPVGGSIKIDLSSISSQLCSFISA